MKQLFVLVFLAFLFVAVLPAQTSPGTFALGLRTFSPLLPQSSLIAPTTGFGVGFGNFVSETDGVTTTEEGYLSLGVNASAHLFVAQGLSIGVNGNFFNQRTKEKGGNEDEASSSFWMVGGETRYYVAMGSDVSLFFRGNAGVGGVNSTFNGEKDDNPPKITQFGGGMGVAIFPSSRVSVDLAAGYGVTTVLNERTLLGNTLEIKDTTSGFTVDIGFTLFFGGDNEIMISN